MKKFMYSMIVVLIIVFTVFVLTEQQNKKELEIAKKEMEAAEFQRELTKDGLLFEEYLLRKGEGSEEDFKKASEAFNESHQ